MGTEKDKINLSKNLEKLSKIADWFDKQDDVDIEEGLLKVKEAASLIKGSKTRLQEVENEFEEIKKEVEKEIDEDGGEEDDEQEDEDEDEDEDDEGAEINEVPF